MKICVIGGGIIGIMTSKYLADRGHKITLLEQNNKLCSGASGGNASLLCFDDNVSIFDEKIDFKSAYNCIIYHPKWFLNYVNSYFDKENILNKQTILLSESEKEFYKIVPKDYTYTNIVKYSNGIHKINSLQADTTEFAKKIIIHPNINVKLNVKALSLITQANKITHLVTTNGTEQADVFILCRNISEGPVLIVPVYGQTKIKQIDDNIRLCNIDSESYQVTNKLNNQLRLSSGAIIRNNREDAITDLSENDEHLWDKILINHRSITPDSLPIICQDVKIKNLYYNGGHGFLGWSLSFVSAKIMADLIEGKHNPYIE